MSEEKGFTLLEMLVALAIFAMISAITYAAIMATGEGFAMLGEQRVELTQVYQAGRRMRMDISYLAVSRDARLNVLKVEHDYRAGNDFDQLWLLVREAGTPGLSRVHYYLDEDTGFLVRVSSMPWARAGQKPLLWKIGRVTSFRVQARDEDGRWQDVWDAGNTGRLPGAIRIQWRNANGEQEVLQPVFVKFAP